MKNNSVISKPTQLPESNEEAIKWQNENYLWWQKNPMRYDWKSDIKHKEFTKEFYVEIDKRFFQNASEYLNPNSTFPFSEFFGNLNDLKNKDVLEIGVGNGSHAQILASYAKSFTGIDLTDYAIESTSKRLKLFGLTGKVLKMDAEKLEFSDNSFDFVWSWGVVHHSSNTQNILKEIKRVLRPGGDAVLMVYHRGWWNYYIVGFLYGIVSGSLFKTYSLSKSIQLHTDGAIARYYSFSDWRKIVGSALKVNEIISMGPKADIIPLPGGSLKNALQKILPNKINRFFTEKFRMGVFLVSFMQKNP